MVRARRAVGLTIAVAAATALTGCGAKVGDDAQDSAAKDQPVVVWSSWAQGTSQQKVYAKAFEDFTKDTGIKVEALFRGPEVWATLKTAVPAGQGPDVLPADASRIGDYDFLTDVTPVLDAKTPEGANVGDGISKNLKTVTSDPDGVPRMIADEILAYGIWFNAAKNPGIASSPPKTWDEFVAAAQKSKAAGTPAISLDGTQARQTSRWFSWALLRLAGAGAFRELGADKTGAAWDKPEVTKAAALVQGLVKDGLFQPGFEGSKSPAAQNAWAKNEMTFLLQGSWVPDETGAMQAPGFDARYFAFPTIEGGSGNELVQMGALGWSISNKAKNTEGAQQLLAYLQGEKVQQAIADEANNIPAQSTATPPERLADFRTAIDEAGQVTVTDDNAPAVGQWWDKVMTPLISDLMNAKVTPEQFASRGKAETATFWRNS
ncbi:carbohydrate ABC transporter substrate-binding protein (CUT1 family) [Knoellia remsis]|uniref:Carbohydrate ABC transporter substrate-binding protein (CUT1 family) n=1 Tax=Knoellia remsis TaxID=407159 RepID=A0A2T0V113_9MICO|nr:extracellular solute-binding protein [Knoellia remsis]PRY63851.1 carbohydrate ABC transporter substrate-binding protein (CUT1 family) [Knoellia remsis]